MVSAQLAAQGVEPVKGHLSVLNTGTGWAIGPRHIVTNFHVVSGLKDIRVITAQKREIPVRLIARDDRNDLAILEIKSAHAELSPLPLASYPAKLGAPVFTIGYPHPDVLGTSPKLTTGVINAVSGIGDDPRAYQISVPVQSGNSGGPLLNRYGEVVGIITSKLSAVKLFEYTGDIPQNVNYAIKTPFLSQLLKRGDAPITPIESAAESAVDLEILAERVLNSIVLVAGSDQALAQRNFSEIIEDTPNPFVPGQAQRFVVYAYAEPGAWDLQKEIEGSMNITAFSTNLSNVLKDRIAQLAKHDIVFVLLSGKEAKPELYKTEQQDKGKALCAEQQAQKIFTAISLSGSNNYRTVSYRVFDCATANFYSKQFMLERDDNDKFGYESGFHATFQDFSSKAPPRLNWVRR